MPLSFDGKKGEFSTCIKHMMGKMNKRTGKAFTKDEASKVCGSIQGKQENINWFSTILTEDFKTEERIFDDRVKIKGIAIKARESRNGVVYEIDELAKARTTLIDKSISLNHSENAEDVVGTVTNVISTGDGLEYEGVAYNTGKHPYIVELLRKGLIKHVSIEANAPTIESKEGKRIAKNLEFMGLAFVRHPGIPEASASVVEAIARYSENDIDELIDEVLEDKHGEMPEEHKCPEGQKWDEKEMKCMPMKGMDKMMKDHESYTDKTTDIKPEKQVQSDIQIPKGENMESKEQIQEKDQKDLVIEQLKEQLVHLSEDVKKLQESKSKGTITEEAPKSEYNFVESFKESQGYPAKTFIKVKKGSTTEDFFAAHPEEWY